jgi:uncharacterized membrane protein
MSFILSVVWNGMPAPEEPASPDRERMDAISAALGRLAKSQDEVAQRQEEMVRRQDEIVQHQEELDQRLMRIEAAVGLAAVLPTATARPEPEPVAAAPPPRLTPPPLPRIPPPLPQEVPSVSPDVNTSPELGLETTFGLGWLNRVAVVTLIFGVGFLFKYAVDSQWIGPAMRVALGIAAATISLFLGEWISLRGQKTFARGLTGLGLALLYLSFYAGFSFYHLLPQATAFLLMCLTTAAAAMLALHYDSQVVALLGLAGGYLTPVLLSTGENHMWVLAAYTSMLNLGALAIARMKRWPPLEYLAWPATALLILGWASDWLDDETRLAAWGWLSLSFALFFAASVLGARLWLLAVNTGAYFAGTYVLLDHQYHSSMGAFTLALAVPHALLAKAVWNNDRRLGEFAAAVAAALLTLAIPIQFVGFRITMLWSLEAAALAWVGARFDRPRLQTSTSLVFTLVLVRLVTLDSATYSIDYAYTAFANRRFLTFAVAAASLWIASRFARTRESQCVSYAAGHLVMLWALGLEVAGWAGRTSDRQDVANVVSTGISILMAVYASALVVAGVALRSALNRILGLGLFALVILKLYLLDVWSLSRGFRITAFLALGGLLLLVSYLYSRYKPALERLWRPETAEHEAPPEDPSAQERSPV